MNSNPILRIAEEKDAEKIADIYITARKTFLKFIPQHHADHDILQWIRLSLIPARQLIVAESGKELIGMMALSKHAETGWIDQLYVAAAFVGRGVGTLLVKYAKSSLGAPICLYTFQENAGARRFYERLGFRIVEWRDGSANEENCPDILYEWR